ncbi:potassium channel family protein [Sphingomonas sp. PP-CE-1G-424]|uniref:potassium channel family protein n=1 Tax=Sphingomonas sp. PP-CE-1G-424 TaxID=2135658 RepID=UPI0014054ABB|nr:potassium channel family protein [Sphingomonas sp. PP-CE-1G-424]
MAPPEFNAWRAANDIPRLFAWFWTMLPGFEDWVATLPFEAGVLHRVVPTGDLFKGEVRKVILKRPDDNPLVEVIECFDGSADEAIRWWGILHRKIEVLGSFEPYLKWAKRTLKRHRFIQYDIVNNQRSDDLVYTRWESGLNHAKAFLLGSFEVLNLGQMQLVERVTIGSRNLDFCNLDGLIVTGAAHGSYWTHVNFSSCRDMLFRNAEIAFVTFFHCSMEKIDVLRSTLQDFYFDGGSPVRIEAQDSFIYRMSFDQCGVQPFFRNTEARELGFKPARAMQPEIVAGTYRLLRAIFQSSALRQEASEAYYNERVFERKSYSHPYGRDRRLFANVPYGGRSSEVIAMYRRGWLSARQIPREIGRTYVAKLLLLISPRGLLGLAKYKARWLASCLEWAVWGYGERPSRIFLASLTAILGYATYYHRYGLFTRAVGGARLDWWDSIYFSMVTFTTLGYGDIYPSVATLKIAAASEALLGAFAVGLSVAGFSNRSRY